MLNSTIDTNYYLYEEISSLQNPYKHTKNSLEIIQAIFSPKYYIDDLKDLSPVLNLSLLLLPLLNIL